MAEMKFIFILLLALTIQVSHSQNVTVSKPVSTQGTQSHSTNVTGNIRPTNATAPNACMSMPCVNGRCYHWTFGNQSYYKCSCQSGYTGDRCDTVFKYSYCANHNPCYQGRCVDTNNGYSYQCICFQGYTGATCNNALNGASYPCDKRPCRVGRCINVRIGLKLSYICNCSKYDNDPSCYRDRACGNPCAVSDPCINGKCKSDNHGGVFCTCNPGFTGPRCQWSSGVTQTPFTTARPTIPQQMQVCKPYTGFLCKRYLEGRNIYVGNHSIIGTEATLFTGLFYGHAAGLLSPTCLKAVLPIICTTSYSVCDGSKPARLCREQCQPFSNIIQTCLKRLDPNTVDCSKLPSMNSTGIKCSPIKLPQPDQVAPPNPQTQVECVSYQGSLCKNALQGSQIALSSNFPQQQVEEGLEKIINSNMAISKECRAKLISPICRAAYVTCSQNRPVRVCRKSCQSVAILIRQCIPYPASQMILRFWNCSKFPDMNCTNTNAAPIGNGTIPVRLTNTHLRNQGTVEVYVNGRWGTVCDKNWNMHNAMVVCRQLGFSKAQAATCCNKFGQSTTSFALTNVYCKGNEPGLGSCFHNGFGNANCSSGMTAGVICSSTTNNTNNMTDTSTKDPMTQPMPTGTMNFNMTTMKPTQMMTMGPTPFNPSKPGQAVCVQYTSTLCNPYLFTSSIAQIGSRAPQDEERNMVLSILFAHATGSLSAQCIQRILPFMCETAFPECYNNQSYFLCREDCQSHKPTVMACLQNMPNVHLPNCSQHPSRANNGTCNDIVSDSTEMTPTATASMCVPYQSGICSNFFNQTNVTMISNDQYLPKSRIEAIANDLLGSGSDLSHECKKRLLASFCVLSYSPCRGGMPRNLCRKDCMEAMRLVKECVPYPASKSVIKIFNCERFTNATSKCIAVNQKPIQVNLPDIRLVGGNSSREGRVEIYRNSTWGSICGHNWNIQAANIVCKQLGYHGAQRTACCGQFGNGTGHYMLSNVHCEGNEKLITDCFNSGNGMMSTCKRPGEEAGVVCKMDPTTPMPTTMKPPSPTFSNNLICREFKPSFCKKFVNHTSVLQLGSQSPETMEGLIATNTFYAHSSGLVTKQCLEVLLRFSCLQGFPQCHGNKIYTICQEDCNAALPYVHSCLARLKNASTTMQLPSCKNAPSRKAGYKYCISLPNMNIHMNNMSGNSTATPPTAQPAPTCTKYTGSICKQVYNTTQISSLNFLPQESIEKDIMRLLGNPNSLYPPCRERILKALCVASFVPCRNGTDQTLCREDCQNLLGLLKNCIPTQTTLSLLSVWNCSIFHRSNNTNGRCKPINIKPLGNNDTAPVRLVGGKTRNEGRVEVYRFGKWGTVCDYGFDMKDANVICRQLGYEGAESWRCCAQYGNGTGQIWLSGVDCKGNEKSIAQCRHYGWGNTNHCNHFKDVGVRCKVPAPTCFRPPQDFALPCAGNPCGPGNQCQNVMNYTAYICHCSYGFFNGRGCVGGIPVTKNTVSYYSSPNRLEVGAAIKFICTAKGFPAPKVEIYRNGKMMRNSSGVAIYSSKLNDYSTQTILKFDAFSHNHTGIYECRAGNQYNKQPVSIKIPVDINECLTSPCSRGVCINTIGSFKCQCFRGWMGKLCNQDINECNSQKKVCDPDANCTNYPGSFSCKCKPGFIGNGFSCTELRLYPYGYKYFDRAFGYTDDGYRRYNLKVPVFFMNKFQKTIYVSMNGFVSLGRPYFGSPRNPLPLNRKTSIIGPFYSDADGRNPVTRVYFHQYYRADRNPISTEILKRATMDVAKFQAALANGQNDTKNFGFFTKVVPNFVAKQVIIVTWSKLVPYPGFINYKYNSFNTFQLVLASNGNNLFGFFVYEDEGMNWWKRFPYIRPKIGYTNSTPSYTYLVPGSDTTSALRVDSMIGNFKMRGRYGFRLDDSAIGRTNYEEKCMEWFNNQPSPENYLMALRRLSCPCTIFQARRDRRFRVDWRTYCARSFFRRASDGERVRQQCCYQRFRPGFGALIRQPPLAASFTFRNRTWRYAEEEARRDCCFRSGLCRYYYEKMPFDNCRNYRPPRRALMWGDPHITTLDTKTYSFNGHGEYTLLDVDGGFFVLQGRTMRAIQNGSASALATVFASFASKQNDSDTVEASLNSNSDGIDIYVNNNSTSFSFSTIGENDTLSYNNVELSRTIDNKLIIAFTSGINVEVQLLTEMLAITFSAPDTYKGNTKGLLGTWNDNITDDFKRPDGTYLDINANESTIFYNFGRLWQINSGSSLFTYPAGTTAANYSDPSFVPIFAENIPALFGNNTAFYQQSVNACGNDTQCLYDAALTLNLNAATSGKNASNEYQTGNTELENFPPTISGLDSYNVTYGQVFMTQLNVSDANAGDNVTVVLVNPPPGAYFDNMTMVFNWTVSTYDNITIKFVATDSKGASSELSPSITMCYCDNNSTCDYNAESVVVNDITQISCTCDAAWTGDHCTEDLNECADSPCFANVTCTDNPAPQSGYVCNGCPAGYTGDGQKCYDIDECTNGTNSCQQTCTNNEGSYTCGCNSGYILRNDTYSCMDIDECMNGDANCSSSATCVNTAGSYQCVCSSGYMLSNGNCTDIDECATNNGGCSQVCTNSEGNYTCSCYTGFTLGSDNHNCTDVDECTQTLPCQQVCVNTQGSYFCACNQGFQLNVDGKSCNGSISCSANHTCSFGCAVVNGKDTCYCDQGYTLGSDNKTCVDLNECNGNGQLCQQICVNTPGSYHCQCNSTYKLKADKINCEDIDECLNSTSCPATSNCTNSIGSHSCQCWPGYTGAQCTDIDECSQANSCSSDATCKNTPGSFTCSCKLGFLGNGTTCEAIKRYNANVRLNGTFTSDLTNNSSAQFIALKQQVETSLNTIYSNNANTSSTFKTVQVTEFKNGSIIADYIILIAATSSVSTSQLQSAIPAASTIGGYTTLQQAVVVDFNECANPADNNCTSLQDCVNTAGSYRCQCKTGYTGQFESCTDINECLGSPCPTNANCANTIGSFTCACHAGYTGATCTDINECLTAQCPADSNCVNIAGSYRCQCNTGYINQSNTCNDINECARNPSPCTSSNNRCVNTKGSYTCSCASGYRGSANNCTCMLNCLNGGTCQVANGTAICNCINGYRGITCNVAGDMPTGAIVGISVGTVAGVLLIIAIIVIISKSGRGKRIGPGMCGAENPGFVQENQELHETGRKNRNMDEENEMQA